MEENKVIISTNAFADLIAAVTRLQIIERMLAKNKYVSEETLRIILNIEGGEKNG